MSADPTNLRLQLRQNGFEPLPAYGEKAVIGWPHSDEEIHDWGWLNDEEGIRHWARRHHNATSTCIDGKFTPALLISSSEPAAEAAETVARKYLEERGDIYVCHCGPSKRLILLRTDEPFTTLSRELFAPSDAEQATRLLADGERYLVDGVDSFGKTPHWIGGELVSIRRETLPYIRREDVKILDAISRVWIKEFKFIPKNAITELEWVRRQVGKAKARIAAYKARQQTLENLILIDTWAALKDPSKEGHSTRFWNIVRTLRELGLTVNHAVKLFERFPDGIIVNYCERLQGEIERVWDKLDKTDNPELHRSVTLTDLFAYMPMHNYIYAPTRDTWPASSVNARIPPVPLVDRAGKPKLDSKGNQKTLPAAEWLDHNKPVEQTTWAPGEPMVIRHRLISEGGWVERKNATVFNQYRPPIIIPHNAVQAQRWLDHIHKVYPNDIDHIVKWLAHRRQRPHEKINHALVLGGLQGIGKDTLLEPAKRAVGPWNFSEVTPQHLFAPFNSYVKSVILRISEAHDLGDVDRFSFYDHMKIYTAAPPDVLRCNEKNLREYNVLNCCGVVITTNYKADGIYLPADDRRHYVAWSDLTKDDFKDGYWNRIWNWYDEGGDRDVVAYLDEVDLSKFDPKAPPPKTAAFWDIVGANRAPEEGELADALDLLANPPATTLAKILENADPNLAEWLQDRKNRRIIPHRLERCGYVPVRNDTAKDGLWKLKGFRQVIYARNDLSLRDRLNAAKKLAE
jgi:uncharacterized protein DUF5906